MWALTRRIREDHRSAYAIDQVNPGLIALLIDQGAPITSSCLAAAAGKLSDVHVFTVFGRETEIDIRNGWPLVEAVRSGRTQIVKILLEYDSNVNALVGIDFDGAWGLTTVIGMAAESNNVEIMEVLLAARAATSIPRSTGFHTFLLLP
ncbi:hypothetical protein BJX64DRAFT_285233 [Aspergillus heterothallicus]